MLFPRELEVLNIIAKSDIPLTCAEIAQQGSEGLTASTVQTIIKKLLSEKLVVVAGKVRRVNVLARQFSITPMAKTVVSAQLIEQICELDGLVSPTGILAELVTQID